MISAYDLAAKDNDSPSDPYLHITLGDKVFNEREFYQLDNANPDFHKLFEFNAVFPGCPLLTIKVFDYDELFGDDLIGETKIDLEDRYFMSEWQ
jgi:Ca2+-dependent lipid-binding protein